MTRDVVVIGGGIAGLASAVALTDAGFTVRLFEATASLGGRARSLEDSETGDRVDIGPHVLTSEHRNMLALMQHLGTGSEVDWQPEKFIRLVDQGRTIDMRNYRLPAPFHFLPNFFKVAPLSTRDILSARRVLWKVMSFDERDVIDYDDRNGEEVLHEFGVSKTFIDWFWRTVCMSILNVPLEQCSAGSLLRFLRMMAGRNDFHFGFPRRPLADLYVPGARDSIARLGGEIVIEAPVSRLLEQDGKFKGVLLGDGTRVEVEQCVVAVPPQALSRMLPDDMKSGDERFRNLGDFAPSPYISSYLWFREKLTSERFWARIWSPRNVNYDFYDLANIRADLVRRGSLIATNSIFVERTAEFDDARIVEHTLHELGEIFPAATRENLEHARVHRIPMAVPAPRPGFERMRPSCRGTTRGLFLAGDWLQTGLPASMESAVRSGFLAAEAIAQDHGMTPRYALPLGRMQGFSGWLWRRAHSLDRGQGSGAGELDNTTGR